MIVGRYKEHRIFIDGLDLDVERSRKVMDHAPDVLWAYHGSGPSQCALALLIHFGATDQEALDFHQEFKRDVIAELPDADFEMDNSKVTEWLEARRIFHREFESDNKGC